MIPTLGMQISKGKQQGHSLLRCQHFEAQWLWYEEEEMKTHAFV